MDAEIFKIILEVFGGLGLFLYGMKVMSDGLEHTAGGKLEKIIEVLTKNKFFGVIVGAIVTVIVQSSSATTVMVVGFVNASIMSLTQAVGIIMGANIGTTFTAQLVSFKLTAIAPVAIGIGVMVKLFAKDKKVAQIAEILIGFGILFFGMDVMKGAMKPLRSYEGFTTLLLSFGSGSIIDLFLAVLTGFAVTAIIQSSSATTGLLVALASEGLLPIEAAFPIVLGSNIGTCVTAMISSIGASKNARRAALMHMIFNVTGAAIFLVPGIRHFTIDLVKNFAVSSQRQLANAHTFFNITNTLILLPFASPIIKLVEKAVPITEDEHARYSDMKYLDDRILETPSIAIGQVIKEVLHMGNLAKKSYNYSKKAILEDDIDVANKAFKLEKVLNKLEHSISKYMYEFSSKDLSPEQRNIIEGLFSTISDIERIGDHSDNISELAVYKNSNHVEFSDSAQKELDHMFERVGKSYKQALDAIKLNDLSLAKSILEREGEIDLLEKRLRKKHIQRLNTGKCDPSAGIIFLDMISNLERIADHASNIAFAIIDKNEN